MAVEISTWADLIAINSGLDGDYILMNSLDSGDAGFPASWTPLGNNTTKFTGTFDGDNYSISDLYYYSTSADYIGLFGSTNYADLSNIVIIDADIRADDYVGSLAGNADYSNITNCCSKNLYVSSKDDNCGGLIGYSDYTIVTNCYTTGVVYCDDDNVGGLIGYSWYGIISSCYSTCSVTGNGYVGGLSGNAYNGFYYNCHATGDIISDGMYVGGLMGMKSYGATINCYATGNVTSTLNRVGGLLGANSTSHILINCYSTGSASGSADVGGLLGYNTGTVTNCFWDTETSGNATSIGTELGKTTAEMKTKSTFTNWAIADLSKVNLINPAPFIIEEGVTYPVASSGISTLSKVTGFVTESSNPVQSAKIIIIDTTSNIIENVGYTDATGEYSLNARTGTYHIFCEYMYGGDKYIDSSRPDVVVP